MNNFDKMLFVKMGNKLIFKEPLKNIKYAVEQYQKSNVNIKRNDRYDIYKPNYNQQSNMSNKTNNSNYSNNNNYNMNQGNRKRNFKNMDIIPKFIAYENSQEVNKELANKLVEKKAKLNTFINAYISEEQSDFTAAINGIESEMDRYKSIMEQQKDKDFEGFKDLIGFINNNKTNENLKSFQNMSLNDYKNMNYDIKKRVLAGIFENRELLAKKLDINKTSNPASRRANSMNYSKNIYNNINNNNYGVNNNYNNSNNNNYNNYNMMIQNKVNITQEQIDLFKIFVNNQKIPNNHVENYFNKSNPKVMDAAENYYKNIYKTDYLTFTYKYNNRGSKVHKFRFSGNIDALFLAAQEDYLSVSNPRLILENGREITKDKKIKCIGALNIENNSIINVW